MIMPIAKELSERTGCTPSQLTARQTKIGLRGEGALLQKPQCFREILKEHTGRVLALVECRGELVPASRDKTIKKVWDPSIWTCQETLQRHTSAVNAIAECSGQLVSGSDDRTIKVWDPSTGVYLETLHTSIVKVLEEFGGQLVSGSDDRPIKVWDPRTWTCQETLQGHTDLVMALVECSGQLVSRSYDNTIKVWDPSTWVCQETLRGLSLASMVSSCQGTRHAICGIHRPGHAKRCWRDTPNLSMLLQNAVGSL